MTTPEKMKASIQSVIQAMMDRVMENVLIKDPFVAEVHHTKKPLYAALVPDEIFKGSHFERRFVTPFGSAWEKLAVVAADSGLGHGELTHSITGTVKAERLRRIQEVLNNLEYSARGAPKVKPNWAQELSYVLAGGGEEIPTTVICDVYAEDNTTGERLAFELKAPLPNSDQTKVSKEKILKLYSMSPRPITASYFALPYNPYGSKASYAWTFPGRWFDMKNDPVVLIGDEFWERIGGTGTYQAFIEAVNEIGTEYKERIYREFLGIEPPLSGLDVKL